MEHIKGKEIFEEYSDECKAIKRGKEKKAMVILSNGKYFVEKPASMIRVWETVIYDPRAKVKEE